MTVFRTVRRNGTVIRKDSFTSRYIADPMLFYVGPKFVPKDGGNKFSGGLKFAIITVALLAVEAGVLFTVFSLGGPKDAQATHIEEPARVPIEPAISKPRARHRCRSGPWTS